MARTSLTNPSVPAPTAASHAATKQYVDDADALRLLSTDNRLRGITRPASYIRLTNLTTMTLAGWGGLGAIATGTRFLFIAQTNPVDNGIYENDAGGNFVRVADMAAGSSVSGGLLVAVNRGEPGTFTYADSTWMITTSGALPNNIVVATDALDFELQPDHLLAAHMADTVGAHAASAIGFTPAGGIAATDVQAAIIEAVTDAVAAFQVIYDADNIGKVFDFAGPSTEIPAKHLAAFGQALSRTTYSALFAKICPIAPGGGACTADASNERITTSVPHGLVIGDSVFLEVIGAGATGLTANTQYYVQAVPTTTTVVLAASRTIAAATGVVTPGAAINISANGTGIVLRHAPHGISGSTTFLAPDYRGRDGIGLDDMGGSDAGVMSWSNVDGLPAGEGLHTLAATESGQPGFSQASGTESANHTHGIGGGGNFGTGTATVNIPRGTSTNFTTINGLAMVNQTNTQSANHTHTTTVAAAAAAAGHNTIQPSLLVNKIIYAGV